MPSDQKAPASSLNRTSVGLKHVAKYVRKPAAPAPQSNQRGIETIVAQLPQERLLGCLNRTSVGLKPRSARRARASRRGLNRTSVGLKHPQQRRQQQPHEPRLNRTSVGLKPDPHAEPIARRDLASIEPAWD